MLQRSWTGHRGTTNTFHRTLNFLTGRSDHNGSWQMVYGDAADESSLLNPVITL
ncbi:hypothetical protein ANCCEY_10221 [Ancylostoma ceylanicum]|uniref:Uncharacterized protein n=1 Tax=Ancylostoma ceylanicum TaxID=53326 RepID=A0A0D6LSR8_9BILA|nr:hypothetical protein ANCCEY_10221 [Ancylostoma ceylanicum]